MLLFHNDYNEICHPAILDKLQANVGCPTGGYGADDICENARNLIRKACGDDSLSVHFLVGGTQTNLTVIDACLRPLGWKRTASGELYDNNSTMIQKIMTYEALAKEEL